MRGVLAQETKINDANVASKTNIAKRNVFFVVSMKISPYVFSILQDSQSKCRDTARL